MKESRSTVVLLALSLSLSADLAACSSPAAAPTFTPPPSVAHTAVPPPTSTPSDTPLPPSETPLPPSDTPSPTDTPASTATRKLSAPPPTDTATPSPLELLGACPGGAPGAVTHQAKLTIINKSGADLYMKLVGQRTGACYLLTIPAGTAAEPVKAAFPLLADVYERATFSCGQVTSGALIVDGNINLTFKPCP